MTNRVEATALIAELLVAATQAPQAPAATGDFPFDVTQILQFGLLGMIFLCVLFRKFLVPEWTLKSLEEHSATEKDELARRLVETREQLDKLQDVFQDQMIPALTRATEVNARYNEELQAARYRRQMKEANRREERDE